MSKIKLSNNIIIANKVFHKTFYIFNPLFLLMKKRTKLNFGGNNQIIFTNNDKNANNKEIFKFIKENKLKINISPNIQNCIIKIDITSKLTDSTININNTNVHINIGKNNKICNSHFDFVGYKNQILDIGDNNTILGVDFLITKCPGIEIKNDCLISFDVRFWPSDGHNIKNIKDKMIINDAQKPIIINNHTWIAHGVKILKEVSIPANTIIGAYSVVTTHFEEENTIIAGNPAKIIKKDMEWDINII